MKNEYSVWMPKLTEDTARARRDEIVRATIEVMRNKGVASASIADISTASGLSPGSIYSHFPGKSDIVASVARAAIGERTQRLDERLPSAGGSGPRHPSAVVGAVVGVFDEEQIPFSLVLQLWGEAVIDPEIRAVFDESIETVRSFFTPHARVWLERDGTRAKPAEVRAVVSGMLALAQSYIVRSALLGRVSWDTHLAHVRAAAS